MMIYPHLRTSGPLVECVKGQNFLVKTGKNENKQCPRKQP